MTKDAQSGLRGPMPGLHHGLPSLGAVETKMTKNSRGLGLLKPRKSGESAVNPEFGWINIQKSFGKSWNLVSVVSPVLFCFKKQPNDPRNCDDDSMIPNQWDRITHCLHNGWWSTCFDDIIFDFYLYTSWPGLFTQTPRFIGTRWRFAMPTVTKCLFCDGANGEKLGKVFLGKFWFFPRCFMMFPEAGHVSG